MKEDARPAPGLPPQRDPHPVPRPALLTLPAAHPDRRERDRRDLAEPAFELDKLHLGRFAGPAGEVAQRTEITPRQTAIFKAAGVAEPPRYVRVTTPQFAPATVTG